MRRLRTRPSASKEPFGFLLFTAEMRSHGPANGSAGSILNRLWCGRLVGGTSDGISCAAVTGVLMSEHWRGLASTNNLHPTVQRNRTSCGWALQNVHFRSSDEVLETLCLATEAADLGIFDWDPISGELHWSAITRQMFGVAHEATLTIESFMERLHPDDHQRVREAMQLTLHPEVAAIYDIEYRIVRPDGEERLLGAKGKAFFEAAEGERRATRFLGTVLDRTEQKRVQTALVEAEQLAVTGRLAASIAHDIRNPLDAVSNCLYLLREELDEQLRREYLRVAESELARASEIAANTLRFYRDPKGQSRVGLTPLLESVLGLFKGRLAVRGVELDMVCEEGAEVTASQGELTQVLVNLVGNAIDAMPDGGRLCVRSRTFPYLIGHRKPGAGICIADNGHGMTGDILKRIFEPFYTTKGKAGTGLGLWLSREIVRKYGFKLLVKSRPQRGTVFSVYMPDQSEKVA